MSNIEKIKKQLQDLITELEKVPKNSRLHELRKYAKSLIDLEKTDLETDLEEEKREIDEDAFKILSKIKNIEKRARLKFKFLSSNKIPRNISNIVFIALTMFMKFRSQNFVEMRDINLNSATSNLKKKIKIETEEICKKVRGFLRIYTTNFYDVCKAPMRMYMSQSNIDIDWTNLSILTNFVDPLNLILNDLFTLMERHRLKISYELKLFLRTNVERPEFMNDAMDFDDMFIAFLQTHQLIDISKIDVRAQSKDFNAALLELKKLPQSELFKIEQNKGPRNRFIKFLYSNKGDEFLWKYQKYQKLKELLQALFLTINTDWNGLEQQFKKDNSHNFCIEIWRMLWVCYECFAYFYYNLLLADVIPAYERNVVLAFTFENWIDIKKQR
jgi:hypothetical protein